LQPFSPSHGTIVSYIFINQLFWVLHSPARGGQAVALGITHANPNAMAAYAIGSYRIDYSLLGGMLVLFPEIGRFETIDGQGSNLFSFTWPQGLPAGITGYFQVLVFDPSAPQGWAFTNALQGTQQSCWTHERGVVRLSAPRRYLCSI
jgi:hypothetical protein